jgi:hypothetical protein
MKRRAVKHHIPMYGLDVSDSVGLRLGGSLAPKRWGRAVEAPARGVCASCEGCASEYDAWPGYSTRGSAKARRANREHRLPQLSIVDTKTLPGEAVRPNLRPVVRGSRPAGKTRQRQKQVLRGTLA